jgi:putative ABC transport system permease protein
VNAVLLKPLPYSSCDRIVGLWHGAPKLGYDQFGISPGIFHLYLTESRVYEAMGLYLRQERTLTEQGEAERVPAIVSTARLFDVIGVRPLMGRTYTEEEAARGGPAVAVVQTMGEVAARSIVRLTFTALTLGVAAVMALLLGAIPRRLRFA